MGKLMIIVGIVIGILGILVIRTLNPIHSVLYLVGLFGGIGILLILLGMEFVGLTYLIVYVGAIAILFLFVIMMLNIRLIELEEFSSISGESSLSNVLLGGLVLSLAILILGEDSKIGEIGRELVGIREGGDWESMIISISNIEIIGEMLYGNYSMITLLTSLVLLMVMIGVIVIVRG